MKKLENFTNVEAPSAEYPFGNVKDNTGTGNGTPVNRNTMSDIWQFFAKLASEAGITPNDVFDNEYDGFQTWEAFRTLTRPYKVYAAAMLQSGTSAPTATIFQNEIGAIVWTRSDVGKYIGTLSGAFLSAKTFIIAPNNCFANQDARVYVVRANDNDVYLQTRDSSGALTDGLLDNVSIEIRQYD